MDNRGCALILFFTTKSTKEDGEIYHLSFYILHLTLKNMYGARCSSMTNLKCKMTNDKSPRLLLCSLR
jgi:hypothetical protein